RFFQVTAGSWQVTAGSWQVITGPGKAITGPGQVPPGAGDQVCQDLAVGLRDDFGSLGDQLGPQFFPVLPPPLLPYPPPPAAGPSTCAWAWPSFGPRGPAHLVWARPGPPSNRAGGRAPRPATRVLALCTRSPPERLTTASPAESYPRYSSWASPSSRMGTQSRLPTCATIPHICRSPLLGPRASSGADHAPLSRKRHGEAAAATTAAGPLPCPPARHPS